jgi:hypothetical protein
MKADSETKVIRVRSLREDGTVRLVRRVYTAQEVREIMDNANRQERERKGKPSRTMTYEEFEADMEAIWARDGKNKGRKSAAPARERLAVAHA